MATGRKPLLSGAHGVPLPVVSGSSGPPSPPAPFHEAVPMNVLEPVTDQILEAWRVNNRVNLLLIDSISDAGLRVTLSRRGGRNVVRQFAHIHNNRVWHLDRRAKTLANGAHLFDTYDEPDRRTLAAALQDSSGRIEQLIQLAAQGAPGIHTLKRGLVAHVAYFVAHESHHRGNILLTLKQCGHRIDKKVQYAIWDWDRV